eukprot:781845-Amphidinium_carterae.1
MGSVQPVKPQCRARLPFSVSATAPLHEAQPIVYPRVLKTPPACSKRRVCVFSMLEESTLLANRCCTWRINAFPLTPTTCVKMDILGFAPVHDRMESTFLRARSVSRLL